MEHAIFPDLAWSILRAAPTLGDPMTAREAYALLARALDLDDCLDDAETGPDLP